MRRSVLSPIGVVTFLLTHGILLGIGVPLPTGDSVVTGLMTGAGVSYLCLLGSSVAFMLAGRVERVGVAGWRQLTAVGYTLLAAFFIVIGSSPTTAEAIDGVLLVPIGVTIVLLLAMAIDIALDTRRIVVFEDVSR